MVLISRRHFVLGSVGALGAAVVGDAFLLEPTAIDVSQHVIPVPGLPPGLEGVRIACVSDVHLGGGVSPAARAALAVLARERPDVVLLSGDICNERVDLPTLIVWAREARGTAAAFATLGNWEHAAGIDRATAERTYDRAGIELLYNSAGRASVRGATLSVVGIDDPVYGTPDPAEAVKDVGTNPALWVIHAPGYVDGIAPNTYPAPAAIFAGHTHGGQIRLPGIGIISNASKAPRRWSHGVVVEDGRHLFVTSGLGTSTLPLRIGVPPEYAVIDVVGTGRDGSATG